MPAQIALPRLLRIGGGAFAETSTVLSDLGLKRPLIITDSFLSKQGLADRLVDLLKLGDAVRIFSGAVPDPTSGSIDAGLAYIKEHDHDCVIGLGGGSSIDTAKAIAVLAVHGGPMRKYKTPFLQNAPGLPIIAIPTTAGTGSETTRFTVVTDDPSGEKMLCTGVGYVPTAAIVDYELTLEKPKRLTGDTGVDSLTHAIEAYVSRRANPFADGFALTAMEAIWKSLPVAYVEPSNRAARERMMLAATQAGIAFSNSSVALVHGMSRPIGAHFHIPHGMSNAMLLPAITTFSVPGNERRYADCARIMGIVKSDATDEAAAAALVEALSQLNLQLEVPTPQKLGIDRKQWFDAVPTMVEQAIASGSPANNPRVPTGPEIADLYGKVYG
ncbi:MAG: iron-containing alcohol dehydrogenase [Verrucomicrobia bacterium]|nr:iron-containing alcohol dehydrogenase [Verrucomicrobiota bacterium]